MITSSSSSTDAQRQAIERTTGPCMVLAGPGSGKTYVLTHRIAHLLQDPSVRPWHILALTFTNKAAKEMVHRIQHLVGEGAKGLWVGTFHSLFARILRIEAETLDLPRDFTIYDSDDSKKLIKKIVKELGLNEEVYKPHVVLNRFSGAKNSLLLDAQGYADHPACQEEDEAVRKPHMTQIFLRYAARCQRAGALDFDDILLRTYQMLRDYPALKEKYQERFHYILVDEFQDTNKLQYTILQQLAAKHRNLCVIGDDAQSIYAFRGADLSHMLHFTQDFPDTEEVKLTRNFRSTQHIVKAANTLIKHNKQQLEKVLFTDNPLGEPLQLVQHRNDLEEAVYLARNIFETSQRAQASYDRFAVLYRTNRQSRLAEESLRKAGIPYQIRGGTSFYARKEVKDVLAYLRLVVNPNDEQALERVINLPKRGIGPATLAKVQAHALDQDIPLWKALEDSHTILTPRLAQAIQGFTDLINTYKQQSTTADAYTLAKGLAQASGLLTALHNEKSVEDLSRYENVQELLAGIEHFATQHKDDDPSLSAYLQDIALMTGDEQNDGKPSVTLMTMHAAKGLEYDYVYLIGIEEGILPSPMMCDSTEGMEEERRLLYVGITRAKLRVTLSYALSRKQFDDYKRTTPSRFLREIDANLLQRATPNTRQGKPSYNRPDRPSSARRQPAPAPPPHRRSLVPLRRRQASPPSQRPPQDLQVGMQVQHPQFGQGTILDLSQTAHGERVKVTFAHGNVKTLLAAFAKLTVLPPKP